MGKVVTQASMSLDGYIADPSDGVGPLFDWYGNGDVEVTGSATDWGFPDAPFTCVPGGVERAVELARAFAGERDVGVTPGNVGGQAFAAGLVDEVWVDLVPVVFGDDVRYFGEYADPPLLLNDPTIVEGDRVINLQLLVRKQ